MLVTLSSPPGAQLRGIVDSIEAGKSLTLRNVICPANGKYVPEFTINASEITELVEAVNENAAPPPALPPPKAKAFEDPAILSVGKRPTPTLGSSSRASIPSHWEDNAMERTDSARTARDQRVLNDITVAATLATSSVSPVEIGIDIEVAALHLTELEAEATKEEEEEAPSVVKKTRTRRHRQRKKDGLVKDGEVTPASETTKSKGWRQTPLLEPNPSFQPFATLRGKKRRDGRMDENGWATEDATDVQDMGDFDFTSNLAKFDKHEVFNQIQAEDSVADEDRLVAHNRLPKVKPGTAGGKNLHYTENVLEVPIGAVKRGELWKSETGDGDLEDRASPRGSASGRLSRRAKNEERAESKLSINRRPVSRKGSSIIDVPPSRAHSIPIPGSKPSFHLVPSDRQCEPMSALHMLNLENIADTELGLSEEMMTENAGRGIAEVALSALNAGGGGLTQGKSSTIPTVVVLAGNNKSGLRGVAAGRHIRNHGLNVVICVLGLERESELLVGLSRQLKVFRCFGGKVVNKVQLLEYVKNLNVPIELIIDGLLGLTISFEELRTGDQAAAYELIEWANRARAAVLAIDVPTGIDPTNGKVSIIDGRKLYIHAKFVVAMGAPKKGLLEAMARGEGIPDEDAVGNAKGREWQLFVADIGLGAAVWKKTGTRVRRGVEFEGSWVVGMRFQGE
ncbi:Enhancer of mRNA-decapping protein [Lachnellula occidentalis]|uniref:Enhancer of mRNA-decapping protein 3 n=1 Tax=Lachnellula occidentalis TaxID=215460 RepID=A0A8H8RT59_9HELO|nr:Enhancer of mRNA-decapping protein [Lachnellula occidentalis]